MRPAGPEASPANCAGPSAQLSAATAACLRLFTYVDNRCERTYTCVVHQHRDIVGRTEIIELSNRMQSIALEY